ncbi:FAD-dependent monooxygenase [Paenibacillus thermoaerophilus]|uniref:FAD-dependent monooxygenase n=1 Tax=Paenibacillus thermoaerophilus TaxID=1215385 RepID=A0ABW2V4C8_9BACL|nr:FAD-dependent monooxygenase [Paenibacillus thermoaerophilus]TMV06740.1 FAD-binding protein [Paenibacillus thermoaerophilus]
MTLYQADVCIVGAGPAGAFLGFLLAKKGINTLLIERHEELDREFRGEHLHGDVETLLKKYRLFDKVRELGILPMSRVEFFDGTRRVMSVTPDLFGIEHVGIHFPHKHLLRVLIEEAQQTGCFQLLMKTTVTELIVEQDQVVGLKAKSKDGEVEVRSKIVVGADGRHSIVRKLANIPTQIAKHGYDVLWAKIPAPSDWEPTMRIVLANRTQITLFACTGGFIQIGWQIPEGSFPALRKQHFQPFIDTLLKAAPELKPFVDRHIRDWNDFICLPVQSCKCETWVKNGLVIMGDAAHTMSPAGGIGVNAAMKDSEVLAPILWDALQSQDYSRAKLMAFEQMRRDEINKLQEGQVRQEKAMEKLNKSIMLKRLFYWNMRVLDKMPWKGKIFAKMYTANK